jgi:hypothetical protein
MPTLPNKGISMSDRKVLTQQAFADYFLANVPEQVAYDPNNDALKYIRQGNETFSVKLLTRGEFETAFNRTVVATLHPAHGWIVTCFKLNGKEINGEDMPPAYPAFNRQLIQVLPSNLTMGQFMETLQGKRNVPLELLPHFIHSCDHRACPQPHLNRQQKELRMNFSVDLP